MPAPLKSTAHALLLLLPALSLMGCSTPSPPPVSCPANPPLPALSEPLPSEPYSASAQRDIQTWRKKLMDTQPMPAR